MARTGGFAPPLGDLDLSPFDAVDVVFLIIGASAVPFVGRYGAAAVIFGLIATTTFAIKVGLTIFSYRDIVEILRGSPGIGHRIRDTIQASIVVLPGCMALWCGIQLLLRDITPSICSKYNAVASQRRQIYRVTSWTKAYWIAVAAFLSFALFAVTNALVFAIVVYVLGVPEA